MISPAPILEVSYDVTLDDAIAFAVFHDSYSPVMRRRRRLLRVGMAVLLAVIAAAVGGLARAPLLGLVGLGFAFAFWWIFPRRYQRGLRESVTRLHGEGKNLDVLGPTKLVLDEEFVTEATPARAVQTRWAAIEHCVDTEEHVFVYVTGSTAVIVPKRSLAPDLAEKLLTEIQERMRPPAPARLPG
jgi:hypothetical protein